MKLLGVILFVLSIATQVVAIFTLNVILFIVAIVFGALAAALISYG